MDRFENLVKEAGEAGREIDYVKLDVELYEIDFLQDMLFNSPHILAKIKQIGMEVHDGPDRGRLLTSLSCCIHLLFDYSFLAPIKKNALGLLQQNQFSRNYQSTRFSPLIKSFHPLQVLARRPRSRCSGRISC